MTDKKLLIIINEVYPYENGETFLGTELGFADGFDKVILFPCSVSDFSKARPAGIKAEVVPVPRTKKRFLKATGYARALFLKCTLKEIANLARNKNLNFSTLKKLLSFVSNAERAYKFIAQYIDENCAGYKIVFYSYWMHFHAFCAARLKEKYSERAVCVSRCHGFDLYEYRDKDNYIPMRKYILNRLDRIYCVSQDGKKYLERKYPRINSKIEISRLGTIDYGTQKCDLTRRPLKIVSCSWISSVKRVKRIAESLALIKDIDIVWTHFGNGELYDEIKKYCENNFSENVKFNLPGAVSNGELMKIYSENAFDVFINVSESEGVPVSIMEAESFGIPVIATDVGGTKEEMKDGETGFLLKKDFDNKDLVFLIRKIADMSCGEYLKFRQNARELWKNNYCAQDNYKDFYRRLSELI